MIESINTDFPIWMFIIPPAIGFSYAALLYFRNKKNKLSKGWSVVLFIFRFLSLSLISMMLLSPFIKTTKKHSQKPGLIFAVDNSRSMLYSSDSVYLKESINQEIALLKKQFSQDYTVDVISFGEYINITDTVDFVDDVSDYSDLFHFVSDQYAKDYIQAMLMVGDGIFNSGTDPVFSSTMADFPIYSMLIGDSIEKPDLRINDLSYNSIVYLNENIPLEVNLSAIDLKGEDISVNIYAYNQLKETKRIKLDKDNYNETLNFNLKSESVGRLRIRVELSLEGVEYNTANNIKDIYTEVLDAKQKVLILANSPHPDISALKQAITSFKNNEVEIAYAPDFKRDISTYSLLIMHQLPSSVYSIKSVYDKAVKAKLPVLFVIGQQTNLNTLSHITASDNFRSAMNSYESSMAIFNQNFALFNLTDMDISLLESLPPLYVPLGNFKKSEAYDVLAWQKINNIKTNFPLIYFHESELHKKCFIMGEGLWLWRNYNYLEKNNFTEFDNLIGKTVQYITLKSDKRFFKIKSNGEYDSNDEIILNAELYNKSYESIIDAEVELKVTNEQGEMFNHLFSVVENKYIVSLDKKEEGVYKYSASTEYNGKTYTDRGEFTVLNTNFEALNTLARRDVFYKISSSTGGRMIRSKNFDDFSNIINEKVAVERVSYSHTYTGLNNIYQLLILIILLLSAEWFMRKYFGSY